MQKAHRTLLATSMAAVLAAAGVTAAIAADPAPEPPPRIAFLANGIVPADALAAGPVAGQLGAPVYTTQQDSLPAGTADALDDYDPELVIVMGGPIAISDAVVNQVSAATGLPTVDPTPTPDSGVVRAAGGDRFETATIVANLLAAYSPAHLPVNSQAVDADLLDGMNSSEFLTGEQAAAFASAASQPRMWHDREDISIPITTSGAKNVHTMGVDAPAAGFLHVTASIEILNVTSAEIANLLIRVDATKEGGPTITGPGFTQRLAEQADNKASLATHTQSFVIPVDSGTYTLTSKIGDNSPPIDYEVQERTLTATWYPTATSQVSLP